MGEEVISSSSNARCWTSATNWVVGHGSLDNSIAFESPITPIINEQHLKQDQLLLLNKPSDAGPCEIKYSFEQSHEIRQVYVRSTARIYEIYYATGPQGDNEYLCTVRCGLAAKEELPSDASNFEENLCAQTGVLTNPNELPEDKSRNGIINGTDEDGWVEVKVSDSPSLDNGTCSLAKKIDTHTGTGTQDFYEATAEINDASPCTSLTLRLLSLHTKECVFVEEIYVYGEPAELEPKAAPVGSSAGSSLMAMLVPTLLQLSKTRNTTRQERSDIKEGLRLQDAESKGTGSLTHCTGETVPSMPKHKDINVQDMKRGNEEFTKPQSGEQVARRGYEPDFVTKEGDSSYGRMERVFDQLVCRVGRIEALCLRFEENMLKPLGNIETRLQRVEQQLEVLTERTQSPKLNPETSATGCSPDKSETNSLHSAGYEDDHCCMVSEFPCKDTTCTRSAQLPYGETQSCSDNNSCGMLDSSKDNIPLSKASSATSSPIDDASDSVVVPHSLPSLIVTAPQFSDDEEDGIGHGSGCQDESDSAEVVCPIDKPSSLDNALASALAGFLSSTSFLSSKVDQTVTAKDVKSSDGNDMADSQLTSSSANEPCERAAASTICSGEHDETENVKDFDSFSDSFKDKEVQLTGLCIVGPTEAISENVIREHPLQEQEIKDNCEENSVNQTISQNKHDNKSSMENANSGCDSVSRLQEEWAVEITPDLTPNGFLDKEIYETDPTNESISGINNGTSTNTEPSAEETCDKSVDAIFIRDIVETDLSTVTEVQCVGSNENGVEAVPSDSFLSSVDFELPILDVKLMSWKDSNITYSLETLLTDMPDTKIEEVSYIEEAHDPFLVNDQSQLFAELTASDVAIQDDLIPANGDATSEAVLPDMGSEPIEDHFRCSDNEILGLI